MEANAEASLNRRPCAARRAVRLRCDRLCLPLRFEGLRGEAVFLFATQRPAAPAQFAEPSGPPAWKTISSWSLIGTQDHVIPQPLQEEMSSRAGAHITRLDAGHLSLITNPGDVTKVILAAVDATS